MPSIFTKSLIALKDALFHKKQSATPRLIMTLLVKNEEAILEQNILFHKMMGVDGFIITDNNSTDSTPEIIQKYKDKGWVLESFKDYDTGHIQQVKVDRMILCAKHKHNADWVVNCDGDEFWYSPKGDLKAEMTEGVDILRCKSTNVYPEEGVEPWNRDKLIKPMPDTSIYDLSEFNIFRGYTYKVAHRTRGYIRVSMGNHKVTMFPAKKMDSEIFIYHYNILNRNSFIDKVTKSGPRPHLKKNKKKGKSRHWRYFYALHQEGKLEQEYDRIIGKNYYDEFREKGYIYQDDTIVNIFKKIYK